jgi:hypothetical protein
MSRRPRYARRRTDLGTIAGLLRHPHQLAAYFPRFDHWA